MKFAKQPRAYRLGIRSDARELTRTRIVAAMVGLFCERYFEEITLENVAARAGVTTQTIIRHFGGKDGLLAAAGQEISVRVSAQRNATASGDLSAAVRNLIAHYEEWGDIVLRSLAQEERYAAIRTLMDAGRKVHQEWVERVFASLLASRRARPRARLLAQLITLTDIYTWKLLRRDQRLDVAETAGAIEELLQLLGSR